MVAAAVVGGAVIGAVGSNMAAKSSSKTAANAQERAAQEAMTTQRQQQAQLQEIMRPYSEAGYKALSAQQDILGLNGPQAQQLTLSGIQTNPLFGELSKQGENAILQNASATGGLRGGNTQAALAQFRPALLNQLINQQYANLGGITSIGQNASAGVGNAGMQTAANIGNLSQQVGASQAGLALAQGAANSQAFNTLGSLPALYYGAKNYGNNTGQTNTIAASPKM